MKRTIRVLFLLFALSSAAASQGFPITEIDALGNSLTLKTPPGRIVSLAPSNTEILFALGAGQQVVGVTSYCDYPVEAAQKAKVGGFSDGSLERVVSLNPDLVLAARFNPLEVLNSLKQLGIPVFALAPTSVAEVLQTIRQVGRLTGRRAEAAHLVQELTEQKHTLENRLAGTRTRPRVLWGVLEAPMYTAGKGSYIDDLIRLAGGQNIAADAGAGWPQIGLETLVSRNPQIIITTGVAPGKIPSALLRLQSTDGWQSIDAVVNGRIYHIDPNLLQRPGPRVIQALETLAQQLHPEQFAK